MKMLYINDTRRHFSLLCGFFQIKIADLLFQTASFYFNINDVHYIIQHMHYQDLIAPVII